MWLNGQKPITLSYDSAKFGDRRHLYSGDIMFLFCQVISEDKVVKESCDFIGKIPSW